MTREFDELQERFFHYTQNLWQQPALKILGAETAILAQTFHQLQMTFFLLLVLTISDLFTALLAAIRLNRVSSWGLRQTVLKLSMYSLMLFLGEFIKVSAGIDWTNDAFLGLIVTTEIISILENIELFAPGILPRKLLERFGITLKKHKKRR